MKKIQSGFALIESALILVIVGIIAGTGFFVWHATSQTDKTFSETGNSQTLPPKKKTTTESTSPVNSVATQKYLTIKEWGVRAPYNSADTLNYNLTDTNDKGITVISQNLRDNFGCTKIGAGGISRLLPTDEIFSTTAAQDAAQNPGDYAHIGNYYYRFDHDQSACSEKTATTQAGIDAQSAANNLTASLIPNLQAIAQ